MCTLLRAGYPLHNVMLIKTTENAYYENEQDVILQWYDPTMHDSGDQVVTPDQVISEISQRSKGREEKEIDQWQEALGNSKNGILTGL